MSAGQRDGQNEQGERDDGRSARLEAQLLEAKSQLAHKNAQNEKLSYTLREAREHIAQLREEVDKLNAADGMIFSSEKQLKEYGDKIPAEKKTAIETALDALKKAHEAKDLEAIEKASNDLNTAWQAASQDMYAASNQAEQTTGTEGSGKTGSDGKVEDVDFEEVK